MRIVVNHLTRMRAPHICFAGIDAQTGRHVRPVVEYPAQLHNTLLTRHGGPLDIAVELDTGPVRAIPSTPAMEDHLFDPGSVRVVQPYPPEAFWRLLQNAAKARLVDIFGYELQWFGANALGVKVGGGLMSLGCLVPAGQPHISVFKRPDKTEQVRLSISDGIFQANLGVTDIRLYESDLETPNYDRVASVDRRLRHGTRTIVCVGLTRPFGATADHPAVHWLQLNNIHFEDEPVWPVRNAQA